MRIVFIFSILLISVLPSYAQSFELMDGDTINKVDVNGKRQGKWLIKANIRVDKGYSEGQIVEEGEYQNTRKQGIWKKYYPDGSVKSEITYVNSRPKGPYILYYPNGEIEEQGNWARTKNTGSFKRYHSNGQVAQDFNFTDGGKRTGKQTYYYENGNLRLEGTWTEGLETGEMKEYYENGDLMSVKNFADGVLDKESVASYAPRQPIEDPIEKVVSDGEDMKVTADHTEQPNQGTFDGNGYKQLFNKNKQIAKDGTFKNYRLMDGKQYVYDENGLLKQIMIFKEGRYIGDGVIEE